jgi:Skp family chaperone for outer membrane proteins
MKLKQVVSASVAMTAVVAFAAQATAQTPAPPVTGPTVPGICVLNAQRAVATSTVGQFLSTRINQIGAQVNAELEADQSALQTENKALEGKRATLTATQYQTQHTAIETKAQALQRRSQLRNIQMQLMEQQAGKQIDTAIRPIVQQTFQQRGCSVLLNAQALSLFVPGADISDAVMAGLNAKLTSLQVQLATEQEAIQAVQQQQQQGR